MIDKLITQIVKEEAPSKDVAVLMSGGVDSLTCAFSAQRLGKNVHTYTTALRRNKRQKSLAGITMKSMFQSITSETIFSV